MTERAGVPTYGSDMTTTTDQFTVSGDTDHIYVSDETGRIVATCSTLDDADKIGAALNGWDRAVRWVIEHKDCSDFQACWGLEKARAADGDLSAAPFILSTWGSDPWPTT